jgi:hypothetical protein
LHDAEAVAAGGQPRDRVQPLAMPVLELDPRAGPAPGHVRGVAALGDDTLELVLARE